MRAPARNDDRRTMKIGMASPNSSYGVPTAEMASDLEARGYESLWVGEHSNIPTSRTTPHPSGIDLPRFYWHMRDPFVSLAAAAAATTNLRIATGVCLLLEHEILDLAKSVATLDEQSGGRFDFGIGVGWNVEELANVSSVPWSKRYQAMRETVAALRGIWTEEESGYAGEFVNFESSWVFPKPAQQGGPSVVMGCQGRLGMQHVAEYGDGWCPIDIGFRDVVQGIEWFHRALVDADRDPETVPITIYSFGAPSAETAERYRDAGVDRVLLGAPDEADAHKRFVDKHQAIVDEFSD